MADEESETVSGEQNLGENRVYDPTLDFFNERFDPLRALSTPGVVPPVLGATTYDNLASYSRHSQADPNRQVVPKAGSSKSATNTEMGTRRWLPHQLPIQAKRPAPSRNVLTRMEAMTGPLGLLKKCKDERIRIKVWTRHSHNMRGYCIAFVTLFDRHWNLVLEDVTEVWTRPKRRKVPAGLGTTTVRTNVRERPVHPPAVTVLSSDKKTETCQRHVHQLLVRGEQIAIITILPSTGDERVLK